jgi:hypothetical protein
MVLEEEEPVGAAQEVLQALPGLVAVVQHVDGVGQVEGPILEGETLSVVEANVDEGTAAGMDVDGDDLVRPAVRLETVREPPVPAAEIERATQGQVGLENGLEEAKHTLAVGIRRGGPRIGAVDHEGF